MDIDMGLTTRYDAIIAEASYMFTVPFDWVKAIIGTESNFNPQAYRAEPKIQDASYGLMQVLERTARNLGYQGPKEGLLDPKTNIQLGTKLLSQLIDKYGMNFEEIYSAYNSGSPTKYLSSTQVARHVENAVAWLRKVRGEAGEASFFFAVFIFGLLAYKILF